MTGRSLEFRSGSGAVPVVATESSCDRSRVTPASPGAIASAEPAKPPEENASVASETAMRRLFEMHYDAIWRVLRRLGVPSAQLDDAAQEVFWIAARKIGEIRAGSEHAFLYGVAIRIALQEHRRRNAIPETTEVLSTLWDGHPSPEEQIERRQARALLDVVLAQMPTELRTLFVLCELEELEVREAAAIEAIPLGTASSRLRRAREEFSAIAKRVRASLTARGDRR